MITYIDEYSSDIKIHLDTQKKYINAISSMSEIPINVQNEISSKNIGTLETICTVTGDRNGPTVVGPRRKGIEIESLSFLWKFIFLFD